MRCLPYMSLVTQQRSNLIGKLSRSPRSCYASCLHHHYYYRKLHAFQIIFSTKGGLISECFSIWPKKCQINFLYIFSLDGLCSEEWFGTVFGRIKPKWKTTWDYATFIHGWLYVAKASATLIRNCLSASITYFMTIFTTPALHKV